MVKFLIHRPIAVLLSVVGLVVFSILAFRNLPISLLPNIEVPAIAVKVNYPNTPPSIIENNILKPIRLELSSLDKLDGIESTASSETGIISLQFEYGTRMNLAYIEVNEKIDRLLSVLPRDMDRPLVARINTSDIPVIRIQVVPKDSADFLSISELSEKVLKKRLEQLNGVSIVDINGLRKPFISIEPDMAQLSSLGLDERQLEQVLKGANQELGQLSIKDGHYRYFVRMANRLDDLEEIKSLPIVNSEGQAVSLEQVAKVAYKTEKLNGYHIYNSQEGLVITVHKQASAKMNELMPIIDEAINHFKTDYPEAEFDVTQNQSLLLNAGISNLQTSLLYGGAFAFLVLFLFMGNFKIPLIMGITLPISLILSFLLFYILDLSINIISLSGLALGLGMLIDNSIIVIDNITRKRKEGVNLIQACVQGVNEVMAPLISSVLTTLAVFVPLVFLNGLSGALFKDQALSVGIILGVSLLVAFIVLPLIYRLFFGRDKGSIKDNSYLFSLVLSLYKTIFKKAFRYKLLSLLLLLTFIPFGVWLAKDMNTEGLPTIEKTETLVRINWNEPVDAEGNKDRIEAFLQSLPNYLQVEAEIGIQQFLLLGGYSTVQQVELYINSASQDDKINTELWINEFFDSKYPNASLKIADAPNAFEQLFTSDDPAFSLKWKNLNQNEPLSKKDYHELLEELRFEKASFNEGKGFLFEEAMSVVIDNQALATYGIPESELKTVLSQSIDNYLITDIRRFGEVTPLRMTRTNEDFRQKVNSAVISGREGQEYPISSFLKFEFTEDYKHITADRSGLYQSIEWDKIEDGKIKELMTSTPKLAAQKGLAVDFDGTFFENKESLRQLIFILLISVALLYFILAAQFESLLQPLIVIFTLPLGVAGAIIVLQVSGNTLNVMSAIGVIVMLGIMVNDAILKIDTINRLRVEYARDKTGISASQILEKAISRTGEIRLKPILMTSITTILALLPVAFSTGLGADLQRPLVYAVIGGLTIGTFTALYFVPLAYWFTTKKN